MGVTEKFNKSKSNKVVDAAVKILVKGTLKVPKTVKERNKEYAARQTTLKISKTVYKLAIINAEKQDRNMKSYIEHLIKNDGKTD